MSTETIFRIHLVLGYVAWLLCFGVYILPRLKAMDRVEAPIIYVPLLMITHFTAFYFLWRPKPETARALVAT